MSESSRRDIVRFMLRKGINFRIFSQSSEDVGNGEKYEVRILIVWLPLFAFAWHRMIIMEDM